MSDVNRSPLVSVILAACNVSGHIAAALDSLFTQTCTDFEAIVVNPGSPDTEELERVLAPYRDRIVYLKQQNGGVIAARNTAVRGARGEWVATLDPDDLWAPEYLETHVLFVQQHPDLDIIYSDTTIFDETLDTGKKAVTLSPQRCDVTFTSLATQAGTIPYGSSMVRRRALLEAGLFDEELPASEDLDLWLRIMKNGSLAACYPATVANCRRTPDSLVTDNGATESNIVLVFEKTAQTLQLTSSEREVLNRRIRSVSARMNFIRARQAMARRDADPARKHLAESARLEKNYKVSLLLGLLRVSPFLAFTLFSRSWSPRAISPDSGATLTAKVSWILIARILAFAFNIAVPLIIVRRLNQYEFGLYKQVFLVIQTAAAMLPLGFGMTAYYYLPRDRSHQKETIFNIMSFLTAVGLLAFLTITAFPSLLVLLFKEQALLSYAPMIGGLTCLWIVGSFLEAAPLANQETKIATVTILTVQISRTLVMVIAAVEFGTVKALVWAALIQGMIQLGLLLIYLVSRFGAFWSRFDAAIFRNQLSYALPLGVSGLLYIFQTDLHNYFVSNRFGAVMFAIYSIGCFQLPLIGLLGEAASSVLIPKISGLQKAGAADEIISLTLRAGRKLAFVAFAAYAFLMVVSYEFIVLLFTSRYQDSVPIFRVNLTLIPLGIILFDPIMRAYAAYRYTMLKIRIGLFVILFVTLWWATGRFGPLGAISTVIFIGVLERVGMGILFGRAIGFGRRHLAQFRDILLLAGCAGLSAAAAALVRQALLGNRPLVIVAVCGLVFVAVYGTAAFSTGAIRMDEIRSFQEMIPRSVISRGRKVLGFSSR